MDTGEHGWQVVKRNTDGDLFLTKGEPGNVIFAWGPLTAVDDLAMFNRTEDFTALEQLPELEHAGGGQRGRTSIRGDAA